MSKLRMIYLYIFSTVGLVLVIIGGVSLVNLGLKTYVFTKADAPVFYRGPVPSIDKDGEVVEQTEEEIKNQEEQDKEYRSSQRQRDAAQAVAFLIIGIPVYLYHWREVRRKDV
ncbi:MAG: hypothetical protein WD898_00635 [Candidatus Paceibacterota bacterium]